ncbi:Ig-like domain-containing protein, partial [Methylobacterium sp. EM32]|uniref:beta strand repeat-containing protein n=1 Tax=Methylobacterium sp. EM32 TaxID=3163481 RepID=UPI00339F9ACA
VTLLDGTTPIGTAVVGADGTFSVSPANPLADGTYDLSVQLTDAAGNVGAATTPVSVVVDTQIDAAPAAAITVAATQDGLRNAAEAAATAFTVTGLDAGTRAAATFSDGLSAVTVAVGADGSYVADLDGLDGAVTASLVLTDAAGNTATIAGPTFTLDTTAPTGTAVADTAGGTAVASFTYGLSFSEAVANVSVDDFVLTGTNGAGGAIAGIVGSGRDYTVTVAGVTGTGSLTLALAAGSDIADAAGNRATLAAGSRDVTGVAPVLPVITGYADDTGVPSDGITRDTTPKVTGIGAAGASVTLTAASAAGTVTATGVVAADGTWSLALPSLADAAYTLTAGLTSADGVAIGTSAPFALTIDTIVDAGAPATLAVDPTADGVIDAAEAAAVAFTVAGLDPGTGGSVGFSDGVRQTSVAVAADGTYSVDLSGFSGSVTSTLALSDAAGNTATVPGGTLTLQVGRPGAPVVTGLADDTGIPGDGLTSDTTPTLSGRADPGSTIRVSAGTSAGAVTVETQADAAGAWSATLPVLADGTYAATAVAIDAAGTVSAVSAPFTFGIDASAPIAPVVTAGGGTTRDTTPAITGTGEAGATVTLLNGTTPIGTAVVGADGTFSVSPTSPLADGTYPLSVQLTDPAGNAGPVTTPVSVVVDTGAPASPTLTAPAGPTNDATPTLTGTAEAGSTVTLLNGTTVLGTALADGTSAFSITPATPLGDGSYALTATTTDAAGNVSGASAPVTVAIDTAAPAPATVTGPTGPTGDTTPAITGTGEAGATVTLLDGTTPIGTAVVGADGTFSVSPTNPLADGTYPLSVQLTDPAGNVGAATVPVSVVVDTGAPASPTLTPVARPTNDPTPDITGTAEPGTTVTIRNGDTVVGTGAADQNGAFSITPTAPLGDGSYALTATTTDAAGNVSGASAPVTVVVDTAAPAAPTTGGPVGPTDDTTPTITGTGEAGATVTLLDGTTPIGTAVVGADGTFS